MFKMEGCERTQSLGKSLKTDEILTKIIENNANIELKETIDKTVETIHKTQISVHHSIETFKETTKQTKFSTGYEIENQFKSGFRELSETNKSYSDFRRQLFSLKTEINVKPFTNISIKGLLKSVKDMELDFTAVHKFTGTDPRSAEPLDGLTLFLLSGKQHNRYGITIDNDSLVVNQKGLYRGSFGIEAYTHIKQLKLDRNQPFK
ncbi:unnamed protein product [Medioppia subpectinata]|uniref:Uncharacterized protein n=1 Tax=Medioppia subpectinata TaxID=1979941 RepID=A0A7R9KUY8_9ACAR|nr:unnamed protein product [Medioppia subpectinata]CAG2109137.1 unnamed protein product [Medioppia subpectinata]